MVHKMKEEIEWFKPEDKLPKTDCKCLIQTSDLEFDVQIAIYYFGSIILKDNKPMFNARFSFETVDGWDIYEQNKNGIFCRNDFKIIAWAEIPKGIKL